MAPHPGTPPPRAPFLQHVFFPVVLTHCSELPRPPQQNSAFPAQKRTEALLAGTGNVRLVFDFCRV
eukprot:3043042-Rhodomonas_salina.1